MPTQSLLCSALVSFSLTANAQSSTIDPRIHRNRAIGDCVKREVSAAVDVGDTYKLCACSFDKATSVLTYREFMEVTSYIQEGRRLEDLPQFPKLREAVLLCK